MALNTNNIFQTISQDQAIKSRFLSNPIFTGVTPVSNNLSAATLGGVGLDTLSALGVGGFNTSEAAIAQELAKTDDLFAFGLQGSPLAQQLTQKAMAAKQQETLTTLSQAQPLMQQLQQVILTKQQLGLPVSQQEIAQLQAIQSQLQQAVMSQASFASNFLGIGASNAGLGGGLTGGLTGGLGASPFSGFSGGGMVPQSQVATDPMSQLFSNPMAHVFGGLGGNTGFGGIPFDLGGGVSQNAQLSQYLQQQALGAQQPQQSQQPIGYLVVPPQGFQSTPQYSQGFGVMPQSQFVPQQSYASTPQYFPGFGVMPQTQTWPQQGFLPQTSSQGPAFVIGQPILGQPFIAA